MKPSPWYRQFWPWFLIALPGTVVVASLVTLGIAIKHNDSVVRDNYYRDGLAINRELAASDRAREQQLNARLQWRDDGIEIELNQPLADTDLTLQLIHQLHARLDRRIELRPVAPDRYRAPARAPEMGQWQLVLSGGDPPWRLHGRFNAGAADRAGLSP